jgi:hypothetical protein
MIGPFAGAFAPQCPRCKSRLCEQADLPALSRFAPGLLVHAFRCYCGHAFLVIPELDTTPAEQTNWPPERKEKPEPAKTLPIRKPRRGYLRRSTSSRQSG